MCKKESAGEHREECDYEYEYGYECVNVGEKGCVDDRVERELT